MQKYPTSIEFHKDMLCFFSFPRKNMNFCAGKTLEMPSHVSYACLQLLKCSRAHLRVFPEFLESAWHMHYAVYAAHSPASFECNNVSMGHMLHLLYLSAFCSVLEISTIVSITKTKRNETLSHVCKAFVLLIVLVVIINNNQFPVCVWRKKKCFPSFRTWVRKAP